MNRVLRRFATIGFVAPLVLAGALAGAAQASNDATIDHSESTPGSLQLLVSVPGTGAIDLSSVKVTIDGAVVNASAKAAASSNAVARTAVLAIDTSDSMRGAKIAAAKAAALNFLSVVPPNVAVGIVSFDDKVHVLQAPSLDRAASQAVIKALTLKLNTALYAGVRAAVAATGNTGQRQVLVLSDGQDNTRTSLNPLISSIRASGVKVDAVALEQGATAPPALAAMAAAGKGTVVSANSDAVTKAFSSEADALARQVVVTVKIPSGQSKPDASVNVSLSAGGTQHSASAYVQVLAVPKTAPPAPSLPGPVAASSPSISTPEMYGALAAIGLGAAGLFAVLLSPQKRDKRISLEQQLQLYSATEDRSRRSREKIRADHVQSSSLAAQAKQAAQNVLATNAGFEAKIAARLEGAGMALKSSEWLLLHLGIAFGAGLVGLLITAGNPIALILFLIIGAVGPWFYLGSKRTKRLKAFDSGLADTLQLMAGSLSAGLSLVQSMDTIVREGTEPITSEFKRVIVEARLGVGVEDALDGVASRMHSNDFKWVVMAIRIQREVGGNLSELLLTVAHTLREREYIRRHVRALSAEGRLSCWILGSLPPVFLVYLTLSKPTYVHPLYTTPIGWLMCGAMAVLLSVGMFWMSKVAKVEV